MAKDDLIPPKIIPDLSRLYPQSENMMILRSLDGGGSNDGIAFTLQVNIIRLLDASIREYMLGRQAIQAFHAIQLNEFGLGHISQATTHFESCIWYLERFIKHARALRSLKNAEVDLKNLIPRNLSFLDNTAESKITELRHVLAHLEKDALNGKLPTGAKIALMPIEKGLSISIHIIEWRELVQWLSDAHGCVVNIAKYKPSV